MKANKEQPTKFIERMPQVRLQGGFTLVELVVVMAIMGILGLAVAGFIGSGTKQYKYASKEVDLQYEAQLAMNQIGDLLIDAQKSVKFESSASSPAAVQVASAGEEAVASTTGNDRTLVITDEDCIYNAVILTQSILRHQKNICYIIIDFFHIGKGYLSNFYNPFFHHL